MSSPPPSSSHPAAQTSPPFSPVEIPHSPRHRGPGDPPLLGWPLRATAGYTTSRHHRAAAPAVVAAASGGLRRGHRHHPALVAVSSQPLAGPVAALASLQQPASPPWLTWPSQPLVGPVAAVAPLQQPAPPPLSLGPATTAPAGNLIQQVRFPPSPSPLPSWIATHHVSVAVRLQAAVRGLLARRRVREMRGLQLPLLQVALRCAHDLALVRCVRALGHAVSPTSGGHAVFPMCSDPQSLQHRRLGGAPLLDRSAPRNTTAFRCQPPRGRLRWSLL
ncbi:hypothetical protein QYE76_036108 [Lolium multiflorum]|uniref:Uncharacterized protein n=1 Tax=Lolium multiflorum TaxID=4521 RepID=A0AAD8R0C2_LOLMU|nr:hypothetical protein QYE76_036108 [Lolium multiflorum]